MASHFPASSDYDSESDEDIARAQLAQLEADALLRSQQIEAMTERTKVLEARIQDFDAFQKR